MPSPDSEFDYLETFRDFLEEGEVLLEAVRGSVSSLVAIYNRFTNMVRIDSRDNLAFWMELDTRFMTENVMEGNKEIEIPRHFLKGRIENPYGTFFPGSRRIIVRSRVDEMFIIEFDLLQL